jgi:hypothetical protein
MAAIVQQFPTRNSAFQDANGLITGVWYRTLAAMWARTGGGTSDTTTQQLQAEIDALSAAKLDKAGGTMTGALTLSGAPATALGAATKAYVDGGDATEAAARAAADALRLPLTGGTLTGALTAPYYIATVYTVATLPTGATGARAMVSDALGPAFGANVVGGGAVTVPVFWGGAAWKVG